MALLCARQPLLVHAAVRTSERRSSCCILPLPASRFPPRASAISPRPPPQFPRIAPCSPSSRATTSPLGLPQWFALTAVGVWLLVMILFSYFATIMTNPGLAPESPSRDLRVRAEALTPPALVEAHEPGALDPRSGGEFTTEDRRTGRWKPPRAHYDHVSGNVVLRFDHYCPWVWNAIGHFNYRYFIGFLVYMFAGCIYFAILAFPLFQVKNQPEGIPAGWRVHVNVGLVLPLSVAMAVGLFALWHGFLAATNQTTIEFFHNLSRAARARERGYVSPLIPSFGRLAAALADLAMALLVFAFGRR